MTSHLKPEELRQFRTRSLDAQHLQRADEHLNGCTGCRELYRRTVAAPPPPSMAIEIAEPLHLAYEQIAAYLDAGPDSQQRATVQQHVSICKACALEVKQLERFDARLRQMRAPAPAAAKLQEPSLFDRLRHFLSMPQTPAFAGAALSLLVVGVAVMGLHPAEAGHAGSATADAYFSFRMNGASEAQYVAGLGMAITGAAALVYRWLKK
jgi:predicted anti-sigma-YlaC factor YlaD